MRIFGLEKNEVKEIEGNCSERKFLIIVWPDII